MEINKTQIEGVYLCEPQVFEDERGSFHERFRRDETLEETGFDFEVVQVNTSVSNKGVLRGIHFKKYPPGQAKFVSVSQGSVIDLAIDLRKSSPTFGRYLAFELSANNNKSLLLGYGIGHAFLSLEDNTRVSYLCDSAFESKIEFGINPLQSGVDWLGLAPEFSMGELIISNRDRNTPSLKNSTKLFD